ncbi:MAG: class I SAM-dependent methyltransferase [Solirubrobacteraceae bacterium]
MAGFPDARSAELERLALEYETSLSWRLTRPLRAAKRLVGGRGGASEEDRGPTAGDSLDSWLAPYHGERLAEIDRACAESGSPERYALFRELDDDLWALLLTREYELYPHIRALLPAMPEPALQEMWNGRSGLALASQSKAFYVKLRDRYERHGARPLDTASVLDFGCGWGRLTRYLARDVTPGRLYGCDPSEGILDACRASRVPATLARSDFRPRELPFDNRFDLAFAFSVFTHLSEAEHERCLRVLHAALEPGGVLIATIRPPAYLHSCPAMHRVRDALGSDDAAALATPRYLFAPHAAVAVHPQYGGEGEMDYGETVITMAYVRQRWSEWFELLEVDLLLEDPEQVMLTLKRR